MKGTHEHLHSHRNKAARWAKAYEILFWIFIIIFSTYKFGFLPTAWHGGFEVAETVAFIAVISVKAKHFYHRKMHCPKCGNNRNSFRIFENDLHEWCREL